jgi:hypothetical protein
MVSFIGRRADTKIDARQNVQVHTFAAHTVNYMEPRTGAGTGTNWECEWVRIRLGTKIQQDRSSEAITTVIGEAFRGCGGSKFHHVCLLSRGKHNLRSTITVIAALRRILRVSAHAHTRPATRATTTSSNGWSRQSIDEGREVIDATRIVSCFLFNLYAISVAFKEEQRNNEGHVPGYDVCYREANNVNDLKIAIRAAWK